MCMKGSPELKLQLRLLHSCITQFDDAHPSQPPVQENSSTFGHSTGTLCRYCCRARRGRPRRRAASPSMPAWAPRCDSRTCCGCCTHEKICVPLSTKHPKQIWAELSCIVQVLLPGPKGAPPAARSFAFHACLGPATRQADVLRVLHS